jgi:hypothetical protein
VILGRAAPVRVVVAALAMSAVAVLAAPAVAQTTTEPTQPATAGPTATVPLVTTSPPTSSPPPSPVSTIEGACPAFPAPSVVFVGDVVAKGPEVVTFRVTEVREGAVNAARVDVDFPDDARFLRIGSSYLVVAVQDPESNRLSSKVRRPPGEELSEACTAKDLVLTKDPDGSPIDTGVLAGMRGKWGRALFLLLAPLAVALLVLLAVVIVKRLLVFVFRIPRRVRDARARRPPRLRDHRGHADEPPPVSRR